MQPNNGQNPEQPNAPQIPASISTHFMAGGQLWSVDEEQSDVVRQLEAFILGNHQSLTLTADNRPITFSRELLKTWTVAWPQKKANVIPATRQEAEVLKMGASRR